MIFSTPVTRFAGVWPRSWSHQTREFPATLSGQLEIRHPEYDLPFQVPGAESKQWDCIEGQWPRWYGGAGLKRDLGAVVLEGEGRSR